MAASRVSKKNLAIRKALKENGLFQYDLQNIWGLSEAQVTRKLRDEIPKDEQADTVAKIKAYKPE